MSDKIRPTHLDRRAVVYLRQSDPRQVRAHRESTARQYALHARAVALGWPAERIHVIDEDLGQSGTSAQWRRGFQGLAEDVAHGRVGAIFGLEVARLARSSADCHRLLELCGLADVLIIDEQSVFTPRDFNDRLLLGLKGTMSEAELYWMRLRLDGAKLHKARRGELYFVPASGYAWDPGTARFRFDPDEQVQRALHLVFERFRLDGSAYGVARYFARHGLTLPARDVPTRQLRWGPPRQTLIRSILHNPIYAGAYVYGRSEERLGLVNGQVRRRCKRKRPQEAWPICLRDHHPAYISWDEFMANQRRLADNRPRPQGPDRHGAAREGRALLQGLVLCGRCGHRMSVHYSGGQCRPVYWCRANVGAGACWVVPARAIDHAVSERVLAAVQPPEIELALAVVREAERQGRDIDRQWRLRLERARYEAQLAERRYKAIDPDYRVVARTLEREWNDTLTAQEQLEGEYHEVRRRERIELSEGDRARILALAKDLPAVWHAATTTPAERKNLLRLVVHEVTVRPIEVPTRQVRVHVLWQTGAVSDFTIPRPGKYTAQATLPTTIELVRNRYLVQQRSDAEIAAELNRRGLTTGVSRAWDVPSVRRVRYAAGLYRPSPKSRRSPDRNADGLWSMHAVAARVGVRPGVIRYWVREGVLEPVAHGGPGRPHWFTLDDTTLARLHAAAKQFAGRGGAVVTVDPRPEVAETPAMDATAPGDPRRPQKTVRRRATPSRGARQDHP
jgi:DNA invertase Pin-like site-specific DNA recombinase